MDEVGFLFCAFTNFPRMNRVPDSRGYHLEIERLSKSIDIYARSDILQLSKRWAINSLKLFKSDETYLCLPYPDGTPRTCSISILGVGIDFLKRLLRNMSVICPFSFVMQTNWPWLLEPRRRHQVWLLWWASMQNLNNLNILFWYTKKLNFSPRAKTVPSRPVSTLMSFPGFNATY